MKDYTSMEYNQVRTWIKKRKENPTKNVTWDDLMLACKKDIKGLIDFLNSRVDEDNWPQMTVEDWQEIVNQQKTADEQTQRIERENGYALIHGAGQGNILYVPSDENSSWQTYRKGLLSDGFKESTVTEIERATLNILHRLNRETKPEQPIKGLVVGNVQSGKTANMAALMAMAADWGWNMFIVLSGTIDNLRVQTEERLFKDLHRVDSIIDWQALPKPRSNMPTIQQAKSKQFNGGNHRYFTVCLKNKARLKELILWLQEDKNTQSQMRVLVIDDEADQAGINTADVDSQDRKAINALIRNLVNGKKYDGSNSDGHFMAMNYIGYTATPYANVLNESGQDSLYPRDFISTLSVSNEYFGPQQIFGCDDTGYEGLDIVRIIDDNDLQLVQDLHKDSGAGLPESLKDAVRWFFCGIACMRYWKYNKPISMLVHTSQNTMHHDNVAEALKTWIENTSLDDYLKQCKGIWERETSKFTLQNFLDQYPDYGVDEKDLRDYPQFDCLIPQLKVLLEGTRISNIKIAEQKKPRYHNGIHLCIDNCKNNGIENDQMIRLVYPKKEVMPSTAPAFIVVGGATLSRGLTLEGLISTYFFRSVKQSDTLMQMGRWFGYRKNYELIPRLWLTKNTNSQFKFLSLLDQKLRDEIHYMATFGISPSKYGPRVLNSSSIKFIRIVAKNRMQKARDTDKDYSGASSQTFLFDNNYNVLKGNIDCTRKFLLSLGNPEEKKAINPHADNCLIWRNVSIDLVSEYLKEYKFQARQNVFNDIDTMLEWLQKMTDEDTLDKWNIVLAGISSNKATAGVWEISKGIGINKVNRTQKTKNKVAGIINMGALRVPKDIIADIDLTNVQDPVVVDRVKHFTSKYAFELREMAGLSKVPQLLIYIVDKDSKPTQKQTDGKKKTDRCPLEAKEDIVGLSLTIPGESKYNNNTATVSVLIEDLGLDQDQTDITNGD